MTSDGGTPSFGFQGGLRNLHMLDEVVDDFDGDTYRAVYTIRFAGVVYVLHAFQKKSKRGMVTPRQEIALILQRLHRAREEYEQWQNEQWQNRTQSR